MPAAVRYFIYTRPIGFTNNSDAGTRLIQSGKLISASASSPSTIVTIPDAPKDCDLTMHLFGVYGDANAKSGHGFAFLQISEPGSNPVMVQTEKAVEDSVRMLIEPPFAGFNSPGAGVTALAMRPGQRFAIIDAGFTL